MLHLCKYATQIQVKYQRNIPMLLHQMLLFLLKYTLHLYFLEKMFSFTFHPIITTSVFPKKKKHKKVHGNRQNRKIKMLHSANTQIILLASSYRFVQYTKVELCNMVTPNNSLLSVQYQSVAPHNTSFLQNQSMYSYVPSPICYQLPPSLQYQIQLLHNLVSHFCTVGSRHVPRHLSQTGVPNLQNGKQEKIGVGTLTKVALKNNVLLGTAMVF